METEEGGRKESIEKSEGKVIGVWKGEKLKGKEKEWRK